MLKGSKMMEGSLEMTMMMDEMMMVPVPLMEPMTKKEKEQIMRVEITPHMRSEVVLSSYQSLRIMAKYIFCAAVIMPRVTFFFTWIV